MVSRAVALLVFLAAGCGAGPSRTSQLLAQTPGPRNAPAYVEVLGQVRSPGRIAVERPRTLADVVAAAGGLTELACGQAVLRRRSAGHTLAFPLSIRALRQGEPCEANALLVPGDLLYVSECD